MENRIELAKNMDRVSKNASMGHKGFSKWDSFSSRNDHDTILQVKRAMFLSLFTETVLTGIVWVWYVSLFISFFFQIVIDGKDAESRDVEGCVLPTLVYLAREKRPEYFHNYKAGAMNALVSLRTFCVSFSFIYLLSSLVCSFFFHCDNFLSVCDRKLQIRVSSEISNGPVILNVDCDMYSNNSLSIRDALCFLLDERKGNEIAFVQFPQNFHNLTKNELYGSSLRVIRKVQFSLKCSSHLLTILVNNTWSWI